MIIEHFQQVYKSTVKVVGWKLISQWPIYFDKSEWILATRLYIQNYTFQNYSSKISNILIIIFTEIYCESRNFGSIKLGSQTHPCTCITDLCTKKQIFQIIASIKSFYFSITAWIRFLLISRVIKHKNWERYQCSVGFVFEATGECTGHLSDNQTRLFPV